VTRRLAAGSIPAAIFTLTVLYEFGVRGGASPPLIRILLACVLILTAICVVTHRWGGSTTLQTSPAPGCPGRAVLVALSEN